MFLQGTERKYPDPGTLRNEKIWEIGNLSRETFRRPFRFLETIILATPKDFASLVLLYKNGN